MAAVLVLAGSRGGSSAAQDQIRLDRNRPGNPIGELVQLASAGIGSPGDCCNPVSDERDARPDKVLGQNRRLRPTRHAPPMASDQKGNPALCAEDLAFDHGESCQYP